MISLMPPCLYAIEAIGADMARWLGSLFHLRDAHARHDISAHHEAIGRIILDGAEDIWARRRAHYSRLVS